MLHIFFEMGNLTFTLKQFFRLIVLLNIVCVLKVKPYGDISPRNVAVIDRYHLKYWSVTLSVKKSLKGSPC